MQSDSLTHQCPVCFKHYKRREHLQRHRNSHTSERPYRCHSCDGRFQRADVLRRHRRTCLGRESRASSRAITRRRACDRCVRQKKACNSQQPCDRCALQTAKCCYSVGVDAPSARLEMDVETGTTEPVVMEDDQGSLASVEDPRFAAPVTDSMMMPFRWPEYHGENVMAGSDNHEMALNDPNVLDYASPSWQDLIAMASEGPPGPDGLHSFQFLDKMTSNTGLAQSFDCGTPEQRAYVLSTLEREVGSDSATPPETQLLDPPFMEGLSLNWLDDPLSLKTHQILLLVKDVVTIKPRNSAVTLDWSPSLQQACLRFFSPTNLRKFLGLYWAIWHPNVNFVHRPSFDPASTKPAALATMALLGACMSPERSDIEDARMWFNCVEELVFTDEDFNSDLASTGSNPTLHRNIVQALQAAYMVCLYQNWEGSDASKRRIRRYRYSNLVSVSFTFQYTKDKTNKQTARDIDLTTVRHANYSEHARYEFEWKDFATREELIRVLIWIFLLDTAFVLFNNLPPRMVIKEMKIHMAVPDACFQAPTADDCYEQIKRFLPAKSQYWKISFCNTFKSLCQENLTLNLRYDLAALGPLNLFALTSAIHSQIFQYRNSWGTFQLLVPIHNALSNWRAIWELSVTALPPKLSPHVPSHTNNTCSNHDIMQQLDSMWERVGFCKYCPEYWLLANLMVSQLTELCVSPTGGLVEIGHNELERLDDGPLDSILQKYDQTSMRQVNDLILSFQKWQIPSG